jgi:transcriptional regulator with XRE-family HTH domain
MELIEQVGQRIKVIRTKRGMSQEELAEKLEVTKGYISKLENGKKPISLKTTEKIAHILGVLPEDLLVDETKLIKYHDDLIYIREKFTDQELNAMVRYARALIDEDKRNSDED